VNLVEYHCIFKNFVAKFKLSPCYPLSPVNTFIFKIRITECVKNLIGISFSFKCYLFVFNLKIKFSFGDKNTTFHYFWKYSDFFWLTYSSYQWFDQNWVTWQFDCNFSLLFQILLPTSRVVESEQKIFFSHVLEKLQSNISSTNCNQTEHIQQSNLMFVVIIGTRNHFFHPNLEAKFVFLDHWTFFRMK
jgi:hypothetical protein